MIIGLHHSSVLQVFYHNSHFLTLDFELYKLNFDKNDPNLELFQAKF